MAKLTNLSVSFLSLVKTPATGKSLTLKSARPGQRIGTFDILKTDDERMVAYGIVYAPDQVDSHGDLADEATIRRAAYEFMREARLKNVDAEHSFTSEMAYVAESWLVRKDDAYFGDEPIGSWAVGIQIGDPDLWKQLKSGELTGISLAGIARMEPEPNEPGNLHYTEKDEAPGWFKRFFNKEKSIEETEMDKSEVQEIVRTTLKDELGDAVKEALKSAGVTPVDPAVATPPAGDPAAADADEGKGVDVEKAIAKAVAGIDQKIEDAVTKAFAKGVTETDPSAAKNEESFV